MTAFKQAPQTDGTVMERAMNYRSGMPIDVTRHADPDRSRCSLTLHKTKTRLMAGLLAGQTGVQQGLTHRRPVKGAATHRAYL